MEFKDIKQDDEITQQQLDECLTSDKDKGWFQFHQCYNDCTVRQIAGVDANNQFYTISPFGQKAIMFRLKN